MRLAVIPWALAGCSVTSIEVREHSPASTVAAPFTLPAHDGTVFAPKGDVVLVFYRGHW